MNLPRISKFSETSWLISWEKGIDAETNAFVQRLFTWLQSQHLEGMLEIVPAYDSLLLQFSDEQVLGAGTKNLDQRVHLWVQQGLEHSTAIRQQKQILEVPVCYDPTLGNDLLQMSEQCGLTPDEIVGIHLSAIYRVYMLGFLPGFAYMGSVDPRIALPRKPTPVQVKPGAVGIAAGQTGIYPTSPGGWNIVGYTPLLLFDAHRGEPALLVPGMQVRFTSIAIEEYLKLSAS